MWSADSGIVIRASRGCDRGSSARARGIAMVGDNRNDGQRLRCRGEDRISSTNSRLRWLPIGTVDTRR
ncbi:hypothetical protein TIFTF001_013989 [Ficus carica]|uniref:Uncharacterized protein n=1 Tax=Ficus carica TaxID=3494 RepID=A0AA88A2Y8_FICCA|nr:hypothetical protein TIFTF001_013989 [Ficus carica]